MILGFDDAYASSELRYRLYMGYPQLAIGYVSFSWDAHPSTLCNSNLEMETGYDCPCLDLRTDEMEMWDFHES